MKILNIGSLNIDHVYAVEHFVRPGETLASDRYEKHAGGKGLNQSIALARAGAQVFHAGNIDQSGVFLKETLQQSGVETKLIRQSEVPTGHAIIQVTPAGENSIILYGGANQAITEKDLQSIFADFSQGDWFLTQNETSNVPRMLELAAQKGMKIFLNPAPMSATVLEYPLHLVDTFIVNEIEGGDLTKKTDFTEILNEMRARFPRAATLLTLGAKGARYADASQQLSRLAEKAKVIDTTAAGDTFTGYFIDSLAKGMSVTAALDRASRAAAICVSRRGAAVSIPEAVELNN